jgi:hypothetical protein
VGTRAVAYTRISDDIDDHPQFIALSDRAFRVWVHAECWCSRHLTDGLIPVRVFRKLHRFSTKSERELIKNELISCTQTDHGMQYTMAGYLKHNDSRATVERRRRRKKEWQARMRHAEA